VNSTFVQDVLVVRVCTGDVSVSKPLQDTNEQMTFVVVKNSGTTTTTFSSILMKKARRLGDSGN